MDFAGSEGPQNELMNGLKTLLELGKYSDLTIVCGEKRYAVHRAIICSRSGFFDGACSNPFREAETGIIDLSEDDPVAVEHMIHYFYHLDYLPTPKRRSRCTSRASAPSVPTSPIRERPMSPMSMTPSSPTGSTFSRLSLSRKPNFAMVEDPLLATAASYPTASQALPTPPESVTSPMDFTDKVAPEAEPEEEEYQDTFDEEIIDTVSIPDQEPILEKAHLLVHTKVYAIAEQYGIIALKALAQKKFATQATYHWDSPEFPEAMQEAYETTVDTDRGLRDIIIQMFRKFPEIAQRKDVEDVVKDTPGLAWELFRVGWGLPI